MRRVWPRNRDGPSTPSSFAPLMPRQNHTNVIVPRTCFYALTMFAVMLPTSCFFYAVSKSFAASKPTIGSSLAAKNNNAVESGTRFDFFITIYAYDRPRQLLDLLRDVVREATSAGLKVGVNVLDDNSYGCVFPAVRENIFDVGSASIENHLVKISPNDEVSHCAARSRFLHIQRFLKHYGWNLYVSKYRHGRRRHWHLVRMAMMLLRSVPSQYYLFLPDDDRLARDFFSVISTLWNSIGDKRKLTLMLHVEETREHVSVWTGLKPSRIGGGISRIGWVESGNFLCTDKLFHFLNWSFPRVSVERWINNPPISSGVGSTLSDSIHRSGMRMYRTDKSYVAHVGVSSSKMNWQFREKNKAYLSTKYFADGDGVYNKFLEHASTVTASIASHWGREVALHGAVESLSSQVDHLNVYLNGYDVVPSFLRAPYVVVILSGNPSSRGDIGDVGKFFWCNEISSEFHLTADDDIVYPPDYVGRLVAFANQYSIPVAVGVHGVRIIQESLTPSDGSSGKGYYGSRNIWTFTSAVSVPVSVHILGTGTLMYRPEDVGKIDLDRMFPLPNMADIWFGILAQNLTLPMMVIPRRKNWLKPIPGTFVHSIYHTSTNSRNARLARTEAAKGAGVWKLHPPIRASAEL